MPPVASPIPLAQATLRIFTKVAGTLRRAVRHPAFAGTSGERHMESIMLALHFLCSLAEAVRGQPTNYLGDVLNYYFRSKIY
jgi:hypothetical protein